jgi:23S rRNA U2552 (ribose-2'-O)-methylase RlmE/FtsJ
MDSYEKKPPWKCVGFFSNVSRQEPTRYAAWPTVDATERDLDLQRAKIQIAAYEKAHIWELAKKMANPYECIYTQDDSHFHPSICMYKPLSRSFYKMIEILSVLQFFETLPKTTQKLRTAHVAEGPGGFIEAVFERAEKHKKMITASTAMTLKPRDSQTPGWRRATNFLQKHREITLHYGPDATGDMYIKANQESFIQKCKPGVNIFTADGGFDFSTDYLLQEKSIYHLLICSSLIGLQCLLPGGVFVLKFFDIYEMPTQYLISLIRSCFQSWTIYKPATSRPCNSERYLLCRGFRETAGATDVIRILTEMESQSLRQLYPVVPKLDDAEIFSKNIAEIADIQKAALADANLYIQDPHRWKNDFHSHFRRSLHWCNVFQMPSVQKEPNWRLVESVVSQLSQRADALQSRMLDAEKDRLRPFGLTGITSSEEYSSDIPRHLSPPERDAGNPEQTQAAAL